MRSFSILFASVAMAMAAPPQFERVSGPSSNGAIDVLEMIYTDGWTKTATPVAGQTSLTFTIAVREQGVNDVKRIALAVSNPSSRNYGKYLNQEQLDNITKPTASDMSAVTGWLHQNGVGWTMTSVSNVKVTTSAAQASKMFDTSFHQIYNSKHQQMVVRAASYSLPTTIRTGVAAIFGLHGLPLPPAATYLMRPLTPFVGTDGAGSGVIAEVDPNVLASTYKIGGVTATGSLKNRQAVAEFQGQMMAPHGADLALLFKKYVKEYKIGVDDTVYHFDGDKGEGGPGVEARLDIQYIMAPAIGIKTEFWEERSNDFCNDLNKWTTNLTATADIPLVHSVSYGWQGDLAKIHCSEADSSVVDNNFAKLAAKGSN
jgi:subtilase family serine protease